MSEEVETLLCTMAEGLVKLLQGVSPGSHVANNMAAALRRDIDPVLSREHSTTDEDLETLVRERHENEYRHVCRLIGELDTLLNGQPTGFAGPASLEVLINQVRVLMRPKLPKLPDYDIHVDSVETLARALVAAGECFGEIKDKRVYVTGVSTQKGAGPYTFHMMVQMQPIELVPNDTTRRAMDDVEAGRVIHTTVDELLAASVRPRTPKGPPKVIKRRRNKPKK